MSYSHLRWWRIASAVAVCLVWLGFALNIADGTLGWTDAFGAVLVPLSQWGAFWSPHSGWYATLSAGVCAKSISTPDRVDAGRAEARHGRRRRAAAPRRKHSREWGGSIDP